MIPDMDPHYSVLLGDENNNNEGLEGECLKSDNNKSEEKNGFDPIIIAIVIPIVVGLIIVIALGVYFGPKYVSPSPSPSSCINYH